MPSKRQVCRSELRRAHRLLSTNPQVSLKTAEDLVERIDGAVSDLLGEALGLLGMARRLTGDHRGAESAFASASSVETTRLRQGIVYCQWALLDLDCHRPEEALRKASKGLALIESADPPDRVLAQGLVTRGIAFWYNVHYDKAAADNREALLLIHPRADADLHFKAVNNLGISLLFGSRDSAQISEALRTLDQAYDLLRRYRIPQMSLQNARLLWTRGLAYRLVGADELAETLLTQASKILFALESWSDWVRLSLDLIELYMHYGRSGTVAATLAEMLKHAGDPETLTILKVFEEAVRQDVLTDDVVRAVYAQVHGNERKPPLVGEEYDPCEPPIGF